MTTPEHEPQDARTAQTGQPGPAETDVGALAAGMAERSGLRRNEAGNIDVLASVGGVRGLSETLAPGLVFLGVFVFTQQLNPALIASIGVGALALLMRLFTKQNVVPAVSGLVGIVICALFAKVGGQARDYYVPGFFINIGYGLALAVSALVKWPLFGLIFGFLRDEGLRWRQEPRRLRAYQAATWLLVGVFAARLAVQVPLYFADDVAALGAARLVMGTPLYIGAIALAWFMTKPAARAQDAPSQDAASQDDASA